MAKHYNNKRKQHGPTDDDEKIPQYQHVTLSKAFIEPDSNEDCWQVDGSILEGGGQVMRNSMAYSILLKMPLCIRKIRGKRSTTGMRAQHMTGLKLVASLSGNNASLYGATVGSNEIYFRPGQIIGNSLNNNIYEGKEYLADTKTAGSTALLIQISLPILIYAPRMLRLHLIGGTHCSGCPSSSYVKYFLGMLDKLFHIKSTFSEKKLGWYPRGGGNIYLDVQPMKQLESITLIDQGTIDYINISIISKNYPYEKDKLIQYIRGVIIDRFGSALPITIQYSNDDRGNNDNGLYIQYELITDNTTLCTSVLFQKKKHKNNNDDEKVFIQQNNVDIDESIDVLLSDYVSGACADEHLTDQLIIFAALAKGESKIRTREISLHSETAIYYAEKLAKAKVDIIKEEKTYIIVIEGIGLKNEHLICDT